MQIKSTHLVQQTGKKAKTFAQTFTYIQKPSPQKNMLED